MVPSYVDLDDISPHVSDFYLYRILEVTCAALFVHGLGLGAIYVSGFILTLRDTM